MQNKTSVFDYKKQQHDLIKKNTSWRKKGINGPREESLPADPKEKPVNEKAKEDPKDL